MKDEKGHGSNPRGVHSLGVEQVGTLPLGLTVRAGPSKEIRNNDRAASFAHEIQLVGDGNKVHYRGEVIDNGHNPAHGNEYSVGYVENVSGDHKGLGEALYKQMAHYVEQRGGKLIGGMNTNRLSRNVLGKLQASGHATPYPRPLKDEPNRTLVHIHSRKVT